MTAALASQQTTAPDLGMCGKYPCDRDGVVYVARYRGRVVVILGIRAGQLGERGPLEVRCLDCAHDELDLALAEEVTSRAICPIE